MSGIIRAMSEWGMTDWSSGNRSKGDGERRA